MVPETSGSHLRFYGLNIFGFCSVVKDYLRVGVVFVELILLGLLVLKAYWFS